MIRLHAATAALMWWLPTTQSVEYRVEPSEIERSYRNISHHILMSRSVLREGPFSVPTFRPIFFSSWAH